jgi:hypothetical protein
MVQKIYSQWRICGLAIICQILFSVVFGNENRVCAYTLGDNIIESASSHIGVCEEGGNNRGRDVEIYLKSVGLGPGYAWCSAFVVTILDYCSVPHNINAWAPSAVSKNVVWQRGDGSPPEPGDVFGIYYESKGRVGHVGFIEKWDDKYAHTIEGNTNDAGSRDGDCVHRKKRSIRTIYKVSRHHERNS